MILSKDSKVQDILNRPDAVALLEGYLPGFTKNPMLQMAMGMTLTTVAQMAPHLVKPEWVSEIDEKLKALGA